MNRIAKSKGDVGEKAFLSWVGELRVKHAMAIKVEKRQVPMVRIWSAGSPAGKDVWVPAAKSGADFFGSSGGQHFEVEVKTTRQPRLNLRDAFSSRKKDRTTGKSAVSEPYRQLKELQDWEAVGMAYSYVFWVIDEPGKFRTYLVPLKHWMNAIEDQAKSVNEEWAKKHCVKRKWETGWEYEG